MTRLIKHKISGFKSLQYFVTILIIAVLPFSLNAQSKYELKLKKQYEKGNIEKCLQIANNYIRKSKDKSAAYYYKSLIFYTDLNSAYNQNDSIRILKKSLVNYDKFIRYRKTQINTLDNNQLNNKLHVECSHMADHLYKSESKHKSKHFYDWLARTFCDTTIQYSEFHKPLVEIQVIRGPVFSNSDSLTRLRKALITESSKLVGTPYRYGGETEKGLDCSGFTMYTYKMAGINLPHNASMQSQLGATISLEESRPGDLIFFGTTRAYHAGMIYDNQDGKITLIHCVSGGVNIHKEGDSNLDYWLKNVLVVKRIVGENIEAQLQAQK